MVLGVRSAEKTGGDIEAQLPAAYDDLASLAETEGGVDTGLQDAARANRDGPEEALRFRDIDDTVGVITVVLVR